ncbi:MAG TPA: iron-sulfur cluster repair di-iron protein [Polyangia bacterium]|jgi:regulator of cell morphogenesis and NO signaling
MTSLDRTKTVAQIVIEHSECARVFQEHHIDFCCHGNVTLDEACASGPARVAVITADLERAIAERGGAPATDDVQALSVPALVARLVDRHHGYLRRTLPFVTPLLAKVARVHGEHNPKLEGLHGELLELVTELEPHLDHEEAVLFPALMAGAPDRASAAAELRAMFEEHQAVGARLARMRALADDFTTPEWGCGSYRALMKELQELETDLLRHVHLENHVLMPRFAGPTAS